MIDLHSHSSASDGKLSPHDAALYAFEKNLSVWALTDHDTCAGLHEAALVCIEKGITFIPGIEINISWPTGEFHLLGLGLRTLSPELAAVIEYLTEDRRRRNQDIVDKMNESGYKVSLEEIESMFSSSQIGRPHFADYMVSIGVVRNRQEAFDRFLGKGRPWYSSHAGADLETAVAAILSSGGIPVLAHPLSLYVSWGRMEETLSGIREKGVRGLEAWHPGARVSEAMRLEELARKLGFFVTAGSDFHGVAVRADRHLGKTAGGNKIEDRFWTEELKPALGDFDFRDTDWVKQ